MPYSACLHTLLCYCLVSCMHGYTLHADMSADSDIPLHIQRYVDRRVAEQQVLAALLPPVGSIIPWLPTGIELPRGWQLCDGAVIESGVLRGTDTPDINGEGLFIRGSSVERAGEIEDATIADHTHVDKGHTHDDAGHNHNDKGHSHKDPAHQHGIETSSDGWMVGGAFNDPSLTTILLPATPSCLPEYCQYYGALWTRQEVTNVSVPIENGEAVLDMSAAKIETAQSGMGGVTENKVVGEETRPRNVKLVYIIRVV
eukprot:GFUD01003384.1.p1 GENE.GFUD01003384.1~~GFUD01003384.1.p1  ORF type:complete len:287 (+),score=68.70 GFUD01003384.1:91-861(+)